MAKNATAKTAAKGKSSKKAALKAAKPARAKGGGKSKSSEGAADAVVKLLQSPLVADIVAVAATAALAALAEHGFSSRGATDGKRAGKAVKAAGKAAAAAVGRRLTTEFDEIRSASKKAKDSATAKA